MESILRRRADRSETAAKLAEAIEPPARSEGASRGDASPQRTPTAPTAPAAPTAQKDTATERRLKLIIEAAPVGLMITDPSAQVLAANRATLSLLGIERIDAIVGRNFGTLLAAAEADSFAAFVASVCSGTPGSIAYEVIGGDGRRRTMETFATAIRRGDGDAMAFLGATWDVTDRNRAASALVEFESKYASVESERSTLAASLDEARRGAAAGLDETERRHAQLASEWAVEREALATRLRDSEQQLAAERDGRRAAVEDADREHRAALVALQAERDKLAQTIQELTASQAEFASQRLAEQADSERALRAERSRSTQLLDEREVWRTTLADILRGSNETAAQLQRLLDIGTNIRLVSSNQQGDRVVDAESLDPQAAAEAPARSAGESSWQF